MKKFDACAALCSVALFLSAGAGRAEDLSLGLEAGLSTVTGLAYEDYFDAGYAIGASLFYSVHENISIGGRMRYDRWNVDPSPHQWTRADGGAALFELVPAVRFCAAPERFGGNASLFIELGAGYAAIDSDAMSWSIPDLPDDPVGIPREIIPSESALVTSFGAGMSITAGSGIQVEFLPTVYYLLVDKPLPYLSIGTGIALEL